MLTLCPTRSAPAGDRRALTAYYLLLTTHHSPLSTRHLLLTTHHSPLTTLYSPLQMSANLLLTPIAVGRLADALKHNYALTELDFRKVRPPQLVG